MHHVVPELIVENYRSGRYRGEFPAIGMFLDLSGFSTMTDVLMQHGQHGAEVLAELMHGVFNPLVESVFDYGGKIVGFAGDGMMALYPIESEAASTALHALTSAYVIQKRLAENARHVTVYGAFSISAKIGLASGVVSWGILRSAQQDQATYYFRGSAVEESAEAEHHAKAGDILLSQELCQLLQGEIDTTPSGSFERFSRFHAPLPEPNPVIFPPVDLEIARLFMPEEVVAYDVRGEFRQVVNLFMRFPDLSDSQLDVLMMNVFELRHKYGGLLNRLDFGDKGCNLLMLWGAPVAYENDIGRALNFLLDLKGLVDFPITSGVTYYIAHAGYLGSVMCEDYTCYGWGVNLASRFMISAPTGETWVDDRIARRVSKRFDIEYVGAQFFKGFASEQKVHRLLRHNWTSEPLYQGELVGRESELAQLAAFIEPLWQGQFAGLLLVSGDAGVGKGRLVHEFRSSKVLAEKKVLWAVCQSDQILRQSFNPLRSWLSKYFDIGPHRSEDECKQIFNARLEDLLATIPEPALALELDRTRSALGALLDLHWEDSLYEQLDAEGRFNNTILALIALLKAESLRQPVVIFLEDLQFTDKDSRDFLPRLKRALLAAGEAYPIAIIVTTRPAEGLLADDLVNAQIDLRGLSQPAITRLTETMLGGAAAPGLVTLLYNRSEGNPYFVEQILRYLQEEGYLETSEHGWALIKRVRNHFMPGDIRAILVARLDQLAREVKASVQTASVLGREFEIRVLARMLSDDRDVPRYVAEAERSGIWAPLSEIRYVFSHGLLRDAAYAMQMRARRRELHVLAVDALEALFATDLKSHVVELAYHSEYGERFKKAQQYFRLAGKSSADLYQNHQAIDYYTRALTHTPSDDLKTRFDLLVERVELFNRLADRSSQLQDLQSIEKLAVQLDDAAELAKVHMLFAHYHIQVGEYLSVVERSEQVLKLSQVAEEEDVILDTYRVWPLALLRLGRLEDGMRIAREGRKLAQMHGDPIKEAYILNSMGLIAIEEDKPIEAHEYLQQALSLARAKDDRRLAAMTLGNMGTSAAYVRQDYDSAHEYFEACFALMHERGERSSEAVSLGNLGWVAGMLGDFEAARSYLEQALVLAREIGNAYLETNTLINLCAVMGTLEQAQSSLAYGQKSLEICRRTGDRSGEAWALLYMGYAFLLLNDQTQAEDVFCQSIAIRDELGQPGMKMEPAAGLIQALLKRGDLNSAREQTEQVLAYLEAGGTLDGAEEPLRVYYACHLLLDEVQDPRATALLRKAAQLLEAQVLKLRDERSRQLYVGNVPWRRAIQKAWRASEMA